METRKKECLLNNELIAVFFHCEQILWLIDCRKYIHIGHMNFKPATIARHVWDGGAKWTSKKSEKKRNLLAVESDDLNGGSIFSCIPLSVSAFSFECRLPSLDSFAHPASTPLSANHSYSHSVRCIVFLLIEVMTMSASSIRVYSLIKHWKRRARNKDLHVESLKERSRSRNYVCNHFFNF